MLVAIAHNAVSPDAREDERDVLVQARAVGQSLQQLGHSYELVPVDLDLSSVLEKMRRLNPDLLFNLAESLAGSDRFASLAVGALEQLGLPMTGSDSDVLWLSNHKTLAKERMVLSNLPTPDWVDPRRGGVTLFRRDLAKSPDGARYIIKPIFEHASIGMDQSAIVRPTNWQDLAEALYERSLLQKRPCFAERYIEGREFNISLLASPDGCEVLPLAETDFSDFPPGTPRIVDYSAKWDESTFAYHHTPRKFLEPDSEPNLSSELARLARQCWFAFGLEGYVRVDFRVDTTGRPWILEINTNPCLSPDAGFAATLQQAGIPFTVAIERIVNAALKRGPRQLNANTACGAALSVANAGETPKPPGVDGQEADSRLDWRYEVTAQDPAAVRELVAATGFFYPDEVSVAEELVTERLTKGDSSEYYFVIAEQANQLVGYSCYGPIACTRNSYDLYWIAVHPRCQRGGFGRSILREAERQMQRIGGRRVYIETSNRPQYASTRAFYLRCGYRCEATLSDYYGPGDDKVIYGKILD